MRISFPSDKSNTVTLRGPADDVEKAKVKLLELVDELEDTCHAEEMSIPAAMHKYIIGRNGANVNKVKEGTFPNVKNMQLGPW